MESGSTSKANQSKMSDNLYWNWTITNMRNLLIEKLSTLRRTLTVAKKISLCTTQQFTEVDGHKCAHILFKWLNEKKKGTSFLQHSEEVNRAVSQKFLSDFRYLPVNLEFLGMSSKFFSKHTNLHPCIDIIYFLLDKLIALRL